MTEKGPPVLSEKSTIEDINAVKSSSRRFAAFFQRKQVEPPPPSVGFTQLFRYATPFELSLDAYWRFRRYSCRRRSAPYDSDFREVDSRLRYVYHCIRNISVSRIIRETPLRYPLPSRHFDSAASEFRRGAAQDASYLTYIGAGVVPSSDKTVAYFDHVGAGEVATRIQTDTHLVQQGTSEKVALVVSFLSAFFAGFVLAYTQSWRLALAISSILPCIAVTGAIINKFAAKYTQATLQYVAESGTIAEEVISTIRTAQAFGSQKVLSSLFDKKIDSVRTMKAKSTVWHGCGMGVFFFIIYSAYALAFDFGTTLINEGHATAGQVRQRHHGHSHRFCFLWPLMAPEAQGKCTRHAINGFSNTSTAITTACGAAAKLFATIERVPDIDSASPDGLKPEKVVGEITLENVQFSYPTRPDVPILKGINITFEAGKAAALVGASGSGKSTIVSLVERFYDPLSGTVKLDGVDLRDLNIKWLRSQIGLVSQEPVLFATTIKTNVAYGLIGTPYEHTPEDEKFKLIKEACIKSNADGFISKLPQGYDTMVGERGFLLSGGQKQRRSRYADRKDVVQDALDKASAGRTTIAIAHRLSTIKDADQIFVMDEGAVLERGAHEELIARNGPYAGLVQAQKLREAKEVQVNAEVNADIAVVSNAQDQEGVIEDEIPLARRETQQSVTSDLAHQKNEERGKAEINENSYGLLYLFKRVGSLNPDGCRFYVIGAIAAMTTGMVFPVFAIIYGKTLSGFSQTDPSVRRHDGNTNALLFFIVAIVSSVSIAIQNYAFASAAANLTTKLRTLSFRAILRQDIQFFDSAENSTGALTSRVNDNPQKLESLAGIALGAFVSALNIPCDLMLIALDSIIQAATTLLGGSIIGLAYSWKPALVGMACIPLVFFAGFIPIRVVVLKDQQNKAAHEDSAKLACEAAGAIRTVASLTREEDCLKSYSSSLEEPLRNSNRSAIWSNFLYAFSQACTFWVIALVFWYGSRLVASLEVSITDFTTALMGVTFGAMQAGSVFAFVPDISSARGAGAAIIKLLDSTPEIDAESPEGKTFEGGNVEGQIQLENVYFRYPTRPTVPVLRGLNLTVAPGTYVALVGASGCGKSTVIQLIERFYDPLLGRVLLDGQPINGYNIQEYRKQIALVSQEARESQRDDDSLYAGTIRFNILLGATEPVSEVTQEELEATCRDANILDFIHSLPNGFDTEVGGKGSQLSGGQKQRIAIARALLRNPKVLLLDEATSALDSTSEKVVQEALDRAAKGRTTIAIAHRLSTIQNADCIYLIKDGRVSEAGTHDELLALRGDYYEYVQLQALKK
ncbi:ste6-like protein [Pisolithus sp. B1]|nr:ste6-like protein [Pisolithus sp. B1]